MMNRQQLLSIDISLGSLQNFRENICRLAIDRESSYVCISNVHMCIEAYKDSSYKKVVNEADIITPDGMPLVKALKWLYNIRQEKISGPDLMPMLLGDADRQGLKVFFYGSTNTVLDKLQEFCVNNYPNIIISGKISPPFREMSLSEIEQDILTINNSSANIVFVALGCPKQEKWMSSMKGKINSVMLGVGGAFPMLVGIEKRAPVWMQRNMLEWLFRLIQDPIRLFKRYFITNSLFIVLIFREKLNILTKGKK